MKKLLIILFAFISFTAAAQIDQKFGAFAPNLDSLFNHTGRQLQPITVLGRFTPGDGFLAIATYDSLSTATEIPYTVIKPTGITTGRWLIQLIKSSGGDTTAFQAPDYAVIDILTVPPGSPTSGDKYLAGVGSAGAWIGEDNQIETWNGSIWVNTAATIGQLLINGANNHVYKFTAGGWVDISSTLTLNHTGNDYGLIDIIGGNKRNKALNLITNNLTRVRIDSTGRTYIYNTPVGAAGTDSLLVQSGGLVKKISATYYATTTGGTVAALTMNNSGAGDVSGTLFNGGTARTISYNTIGAGRVDSIRFVNSGVLHTSPAAFSLSGNTAILTQTLASQSQNLLLASPNGSSGTPIFRQLVNADITDATIVASTKLSATGTPSATTFLSGANTWAAPFALTSTGQSGAATFTSGILNVPNYGLQLVRPLGYTSHGTGTGVYQDTILFKDTTKGWVAHNKTTPTMISDIYVMSFPGTVATSNATATITGTNTRFLDQFKRGDTIAITGGANAIIASVASQTSMTVTGTYGTTLSGVAYSNTETARGLYSIRENGVMYLYGMPFMFSGYPSSASVNGNLSLGYRAYGDASGYGWSNTAIGNNALQSINSSTAVGNTALGTTALNLLTSSARNTGLGDRAASKISTGADNTAVGATAMLQTTTASGNTAVGSNALGAGGSITGANNTAIGYQSQGTVSLTTAKQNTSVGQAALRFAANDDNTIMGYNAGLQAGTAGNSIFGSGSSSYTTGSTNSTVFGYQSGLTAGTGIYSITVNAGGTGYATPPTITFTGGSGLASNATTAVGTASVSGGAVTTIAVAGTPTGSGYGYATPPTVNIAGGGGSGATATAVLRSASNITAFGYKAGYNNSYGSGNIYIGYDVEGPTTIDSNKLYIDNANNGTSSFLYGDMTAAAKFLTINGTLKNTRPVIFTGSTPSNAAGTGAGTGPTITVTGNDGAGYVSIATGTSPTASGDIVTITFATALTNTPTSIKLTAANEAAATELTKFYVDQATASTTAFKIKNTASALTASTTYKFYYSVTQ